MPFFIEVFACYKIYNNDNKVLILPTITKEFDKTGHCPIEKSSKLVKQSC